MAMDDVRTVEACVSAGIHLIFLPALFPPFFWVWIAFTAVPDADGP